MGPHRLTVSRDYRKNVVKVILSISLFLVLYSLLITFAFGMVATCLYASIYVMFFVQFHILNFIFGIVLLAISIMISIFLIKFLFAKRMDNDLFQVQIFPEDHPALFELIREVADKAGTGFPGKVFLTYDVHASVSYNSRFRSLFLPVKKNLFIGLALLNSVNTGELRAIIAHEFGHFTQKSLRLNSYFYTAHMIIYNLVFKYDRWDLTMETSASRATIFGILSWVTLSFAEMVRAMLRKVYDLILHSYRGLSREMENHADQVAAVVAGKENFISALRRIQFGEIAYWNIEYYMKTLENKKQLPDNVYEFHKIEIKRMAEYFKLPFDNELPAINDQNSETNILNSRVIYTDQWASHPPLKERILNIRSVAATDPGPDRSEPWKLLNQPIALQKDITQKYYTVMFADLQEFAFIDCDEYTKLKESERSKFRIDKIYNDFYRDRYIFPVKPEESPEAAIDEGFDAALYNIYGKASKLMVEQMQINYHDLNILNRIAEKNIPTKYFEFDNIKYRRKEVSIAISRLEKDIEKVNKDLEDVDKRSFALNLAIAAEISPGTREKFIGEWNSFIGYQADCWAHQQFLQSIANYYNQFMSRPGWLQDKIIAFIYDLSQFEKEYKSYLKEIKLENYDNIPPKQAELLDIYLKNRNSYIHITTFDADRLTNFYHFINNNHEFINNMSWLKLKVLTDFQKNLYEKLQLTFAQSQS